MLSKYSCVLTDTNFMYYIVTSQQDVMYKQVTFIYIYIYIYIQTGTLGGATPKTNNLFIRDILLCCDIIIYKICINQNTTTFRHIYYIHIYFYIYIYSKSKEVEETLACKLTLTKFLVSCML